MMKIVVAGVAATMLGAAGLWPLAAGAAGPAFSDQECPEATPKVVAVQALTTAADPVAIYAVAKAAADVYDVCAQRKLSDQDVEPGAHYAFTREAQFGVLAARALIAQKKIDDARRELQHDRALAADVAAWRASTHGTDPNVRVQSDTPYSRFHVTAQAVVDAASAELKQLDTPASPPPAASPHPNG